MPEVRHNLALLIQTRADILHEHSLPDNEVLTGELIGECLASLKSKFEELPRQKAFIEQQQSSSTKDQRQARRSRFMAWFKQEMGSPHVAKVIMKHGSVSAAALHDALLRALQEATQDRAAQPIVAPEEQRRRRLMALHARSVYRMGRSVYNKVARGQLDVRYLTWDQRWHYNCYSSFVYNFFCFALVQFEYRCICFLYLFGEHNSLEARELQLAIRIWPP